VKKSVDKWENRWYYGFILVQVNARVASGQQQLSDVTESFRVCEEEAREILRTFVRILRREVSARTTVLKEIFGGGDRSRATVPGPASLWMYDVAKILREKSHPGQHWVMTYQRVSGGRTYQSIAREAGVTELETRRIVRSTIFYLAIRRRQLRVGLRPSD
jgi:hypothetical protein